jgi:peptide/nickel transport system substrate-binding protein
MMKMMNARLCKRYGLSGIVGATSLYLVSAIGIAPASAQQPSTIVFAQGIDPTVLDPAMETTVSSISVMNNIYDTLIWRGPDGLQPGLAESWEYKDPLTLVLHLRRGVTFHNGDPFTAQDVAFTLKRYADPKKQYQVLAQVKGLYKDVVAVDDHTVEIVTERPVATLTGMLARLLILPKAALESRGEEAFGQAPVGTGPYRFVEWRRNEQIVLEAYPGYWRGKAKVDRFIVKPIPEDYSRFAALKAGEVDVVAGLPAERVSEVESDPHLKVTSARSVRNYLIPMNIRNKPFDDVRVRRALNHAVDVQAVVDAVFDGRGYVNPTACTGVSTGHDLDLNGYEYDPAKARQLLAEAGYPNGFTVDFWGPIGRYPKDKEVQEAIAGQLLEVGVTVRHVQPEWADLARRFLSGAIDTMIYTAVGNPTLDCDYTMGQRIHSKRGGRLYQSAEVDALIEAEQAEVDPERRNAIFKQIQKKLHDDAAWIFLFDGQDIYGTTSKLQWTPRSDEVVWAYDMSLAD